MPLIIVEPATLRDQPDRKLFGDTFVFPKTQIEEIQRQVVDGVEWVKVRAFLDGGVAEGWLLATKTKTVDALPNKPTDIWLFLKNCTLAGRGTEGVNRDYLIALAIVETGLQNFEPRVQGSKAFGPFQLTDLEWLRYLDNGGRNEGFRENDRLDIYAQPYGAAYLTNEARVSLATALAGIDASAAPHVANSSELFMVRMLGINVAVKAIQTADDPIAGAAALSTLSPPADAIQAYAGFLSPNGKDPTITAVWNAVAKAFDAALAQAFKLLKEHTPEDLPSPSVSSGTPPWMVIARKEAAKKPPIKEAGPGKPPNAEILKYFTATSLQTDQELAWCGAFVAWCLKNCGDTSAAASIVKDAALAVSWRGWGEELPLKSDKIPEGALVVLAPAPGTDASGHVGFFVEKTKAEVTLLGGNQSNALNEKPFPRSQVVWIGWRNWEGAAVAQAGGGGADSLDVPGEVGPLDTQDWALYTMTLGKKESENNYSSVNQIGFAGRWQFGALALTDHGYVRAGTKQNEMANDSSWTGKDGIRSRRDWLASKAIQDKVMLAYTKDHYRMMVKINILKDGANKDHVAGLLAASHLLGVGGAKDLVNGIVGADGNGTTSKFYYNMLSKAFGGDGVLDT